VNENPIKFALLVAFGIGFGGASAEPAEIDLTMIDYKFVPDRLSFQHGVHYRLRLVNKGRQTMNLRRRYFSPVPKSTIPICSIASTPRF